MNDAPPPFRFTRESRIRIDRDGHVWHEGERVGRPALAQALASWVDWDDSTSRYILRNSMDWCFVTVDETPLVVRTVTLHENHVTLSLSDESEEFLDVRTLRVDPAEGRVYAYARQGRLPARFERAAAFTLLERCAETGDGGVAITLGNTTVPVVTLAKGECPPPGPISKPG